MHLKVHVRFGPEAAGKGPIPGTSPAAHRGSGTASPATRVATTPCGCTVTRKDST